MSSGRIGGPLPCCGFSRSTCRCGVRCPRPRCWRRCRTVSADTVECPRHGFARSTAEPTRQDADVAYRRRRVREAFRRDPQRFLTPYVASGFAAAVTICLMADLAPLGVVAVMVAGPLVLLAVAAGRLHFARWP